MKKIWHLTFKTNPFINFKNFLYVPGKKSVSKQLNESKQPDLVINIESRVVELNDKISDLKTWNISQLNQVKTMDCTVVPRRVDIR